MFEGLPTDGLGGGGAGEAMFRPMLVQRYAEAMSKAGGIGLADNVMAEMIRLQGAGNGADR
jgi:Rod binding domain-containing protein